MTWLEEPAETDTGRADLVRQLLGRLRWVVLGGGVLLFVAATFVLLHAQAAERARVAEMNGLMASAREHMNAEDFDYALDSFQRAERLAAPDPMLSRLSLGTVVTQQQQEEAHGALEELAERWVVREVIGHIEEGHTVIEDTPVNVLSAAVEVATGVHKADLLAHIGYANFLTGCLAGDAGNDQAATFYRQALAADPQNTYANAFWGHLIVCNGGPVEEAQQHFAAALASHRDYTLVRRIELDALDNSSDPKAVSLWLQRVDEMHKAGEPLSKHSTHHLAALYSTSRAKERKELYASVPPAEHVVLARDVLKSLSATADVVGVTEFVAYTLEAQDKRDEALDAWHDVERAAKGDRAFRREIRHAYRRLEHGRHYR